MRLDQFISQSTHFSRADAKLLVKQHRVTINNITAKKSSEKLVSTDIVKIDNEAIAAPHELFFMLYKPSGYCCSHIDDGAPSALRLIPPTHKKLHFAGRLDTDTTGLVLLSSDGNWCHRVTSPKQKLEKRKSKHYLVDLDSALSQDDIQQLQDGIILRNESHATLPASIAQIEDKRYSIAICEGKYHQIKRMFASLNNRVTRLHRYQIADITLDDSLQAGEFRPLTQNEIEQFNYDA